MRGVFVSRQISYDNVKLMYKEVKLSPSFEPVHDRCSELVRFLNSCFEMHFNLSFYIHLTLHYFVITVDIAGRILAVFKKTKKCVLGL